MIILERLVAKIEVAGSLVWVGQVVGSNIRLEMSSMSVIIDLKGGVRWGFGMISGDKVCKK